jgi:hypothetical protein
MSKVLVDRELLNSALKTIHGLAPGRFTVEEELRAAVTAQPAEAQGVEARLRRVIDELKAGFVVCEACGEQEDTATLDCVPELEAIVSSAALSAVTAERDRLESMLIQTTARHFAQEWKDHADDKKLDECLSEGIAMLEAERDRLREDRDSQQRVCIAEMEKVSQLRAEVEALRKAAEPLEPVHGDVLPPIGSKVLIHLASCDEWIEHTVAGYYAWGDLDGDEYLHRVFVRVRDSAGYLNARLLKDVHPVGAAMVAKEA